MVDFLFKPLINFVSKTHVHFRPSFIFEFVCCCWYLAGSRYCRCSGFGNATSNRRFGWFGLVGVGFRCWQSLLCFTFVFIVVVAAVFFAFVLNLVAIAADCFGFTFNQCSFDLFSIKFTFSHRGFQCTLMCFTVLIWLSFVTIF